MDDPYLINTQSRTEQIREHLLTLIQEGHFGPGDQLPPQRELAARFGVALSSIREAVQALVAVGILDAIHGRGVFVRRMAERDLRRLAASARKLTRASMLQILEARTMIELTCARHAASRRDDEDLKALQDAVERSRAAVTANDLEACTDADLDFHRALVHAAHNDVISSMYHSIESTLREERLALYGQRRGPRRVIEAHQLIYETIRAGDPDRLIVLLDQHMKGVRSEVEHRRAAQREAGDTLRTAAGDLLARG